MVQHDGGGKVLDGRAGGLEQRDLAVRRASLHLAPAEFEEIALDLGKVELALVTRLQQVTRLGKRPLARVDMDGRPRHHLRIGLAHRGLEGAGEVDMGAGLQPLAHDDRGRGGRHTADDVGLAHGMFEIGHGMRLEALMRQLGGQFLRLGQRAAVDEHALDRADGGMGAHEMRPQGASPHQRHGG